MSFRLRFARRATTFLKRLDRPTRDRLLARLDQIAAEPYGEHSNVLTDAAGRRTSRVGDYRIVFSVVEVERIIDVSFIGPRGRAYRDV